jgi:hypothetical protein
VYSFSPPTAPLRVGSLVPLPLHGSPSIRRLHTQTPITAHFQKDSRTARRCSARSPEPPGATQKNKAALSPAAWHPPIPRPCRLVAIASALASAAMCVYPLLGKRARRLKPRASSAASSLYSFVKPSRLSVKSIERYERRSRAVPARWQFSRTAQKRQGALAGAASLMPNPRVRGLAFFAHSVRVADKPCLHSKEQGQEPDQEHGGNHPVTAWGGGRCPCRIVQERGNSFSPARFASQPPPLWFGLLPHPQNPRRVRSCSFSHGRMLWVFLSVSYLFCLHFYYIVVK